MVAFETAVRLNEQGHQVTTLVTENSPLKQRLEQRGQKTLTLRLGHKYLSPTSVLRVRRELSRETYQVILIQHLRDLWFIVPALIGLKSSPRILGLAHMFLGVRKKDLFHRWMYGRVEKLLALTETHKQNLLHNLPIAAERVGIQPNSVDTKNFRPDRKSAEVRTKLAPSSDDTLIGVVSRLDPQKGLLDVVAAAKQLKADNLNFRIVIVGSETRGEESFKQKLQSEIDRAGLTESVRLTGHRADIETVIASLDILLMPSPAETFGRVLIEAMASHVAVVASGGGGVKDIVDDQKTGLLIPPNEPEKMALALKSLIENPAHRQKMAAGGYKKALATYDREKIESEFQKLLLQGEP